MSNSKGVSAPLPFPGQPGKSGHKDRRKTRKKVLHNAIPHIKKVYKTLRRAGIFAAGSTGKYRPCHVCPKLFPRLAFKIERMLPPPRVNPSCAGFKAKTAFFYAALKIKIRGKQIFRDAEERIFEISKG